MARAALTKLFVLVILAFIICLPEFFSLYRVSKVNFLCRPYRPCERENREEDGDADINGRDMCDLPAVPGREKWREACTYTNGTGPRRDEPQDGWFACRTDLDMEALLSNMSSSALKVYLEVSVALQREDAHLHSLTLYGRTNHSWLHSYLPEEEEEEEEEELKNNTGDEYAKEALYCCLPTPPAAEPANRSRCLLWLANQTVLTAPERLPWKRTQRGEWRCLFRVLWLALVCVILLTIVTTVIREVFWGNCSHKNRRVHPGNSTGRQVKEGEKNRELHSRDTMLPPCESQRRSGLSTILECEVQEDIEMLLDGTLDNGYAAKLHHRGHPSTSSLPEEQAR